MPGRVGLKEYSQFIGLEPRPVANGNGGGNGGGGGGGANGPAVPHGGGGDNGEKPYKEKKLSRGDSGKGLGLFKRR